MIETITRDDGTRLATVTVDNDRATLTMCAADGAVAREVPWSLSRHELDRLVDSLDKAAVELSWAPSVEAAA